MNYYSVTIHLEPVDVEDYYRRKNIVCNHIKNNIGIVEQMVPILNGFQFITLSDLSADQIRESLNHVGFYVDYDVNKSH